MQKINIYSHYNLTALFSGLLAKFCFGKYYAFWFVPALMFFILFRILEEKSPKQSFISGYFFGFGYFFSSLFWVHLPFTYINQEVLGYFATLALALYLGCYPALTCCITKVFFPKKTTTQIIFFCCVWVLTEYLRGIAFTGFPWNLIGYATFDIPYFSQIASIFGIYGVSFLYLVIVLLAINRKKFSIVLLFLVLAFGYSKTEIYYPTKNDFSNIDLTIVQPAINQKTKMDYKMFRNNLNSHIALSNLGDGRTTLYTGNRLIIWPEAAINCFLDKESGVLEYVSSHIVHDNTYIVTGFDRVTTGKIYNSLIVIGKNNKTYGIYDKRHILPFGEYMPNIFEKIGFKKVTKGMMNFSQGALPNTMKIDKIVPEFSAIICYETAFPHKIVENYVKSKWILNITNDAWFCKSDEILQHLRTTVFRAIEEGRPIIRAANTGISAVIDCNGKILKKLPENVCGWINTNIPEGKIETMYSKTGDTMIISIISIIMVFCLVSRLKRGLRAH
ncbi:MAG: apolipoprotein N-acyltransferase [Holosporales bacterium]|jgi:apolipoprotein N-acyltransferase|nr:apolipoprotein N-acyltransferase [Holosporales bacterium]